MELWVLWFVLAIISIILEIVVPRYYFLSFASGCILTGIIAYRSSNIVLQLIILVTIAAISCIWIKRNAGKFFVTSDAHKTVISFKHKDGIVTKEITTSKPGYVRIGRDEWPAIAADGEQIKSGAAVRVVSLSSNRLVVTDQSGERGKITK